MSSKDQKFDTSLSKIPKFGHLGSKCEKGKPVENFRFPQFWNYWSFLVNRYFLSCFGWFWTVSDGFVSFWLVPDSSKCILTLASWWFTIFYNTVTLSSENFNPVSLFFFSKIVKRNIDSGLLLAIFSYFDCSTNSICWFAFERTSNSFCLLKSTAINL